MDSAETHTLIKYYKKTFLISIFPINSVIYGNKFGILSIIEYRINM
jgi:hypothetical protein